MTQATLNRNINKMTEELKQLFAKTSRKMLELEVLMSEAEIKKGHFTVYKNVDEMFKKLKIKLN